MPTYIAHVAVNLTLRFRSIGVDESDASANAEQLALAIIKGQFDKSEADGVEVSCVELCEFESDDYVDGPQG